MKPNNVHGGFNYYRSNLSVTSDLWTDLDRTVSELPVTMLWGVGDPVVPSSLVHQVPNYYSNYTMELIQDAGHFMMVEKPEVVIDLHRIVHRALPAPVGSSDRVTRYRHLSAACWDGKCPRALIARR